jgi:hypothetical protein
MSASTTASVPSRDASTRGVSTEYDTPTTSAFATPDESSSRVQISYAVRKLRPRGPPRDASAHGVSSDYSTTDTSAVATPEESNSQALVAGRLAHSAKDFKLGGSSISSSTKRKREEENRSHNNISGIISRRLVEAFNFEDSDEALALQLQEAEYDAQPSSSKALSGPKKVVGKGKTVVTEDTEDSALSDMSLVDVCSTLYCTGSQLIFKSRISSLTMMNHCGRLPDYLVHLLLPNQLMKMTTSLFPVILGRCKLFLGHVVVISNISVDEQWKRK